MILEMFLAAIVWRFVEELDLKAFFCWVRRRGQLRAERARAKGQTGSA